jgi:CheY-like chemotaxis protein
VSGSRVLIVEDDMMIAMLVEDMLEDLGCVVAATANTLPSAIETVRGGGPFDAAILDVNLDGVAVFPVADILRDSGVPLIFSTGYGDAGLRESDRGCPVLRKPYRVDDLAAALRVALGPA